jgi:hypothetical protein
MRTKASFPHQIVGFYVSGRRAAHPPPADEADIFVLVLVSVSASAILHHSRIRLSSQGAFPEHFAPEYGNQIDGEGNGQDPESRPCRSDSS